jgi:hypothetical protein
VLPPELAGAGTELAGTGTELAGTGTELAGAGTELAGAGAELAGTRVVASCLPAGSMAGATRSLRGTAATTLRPAAGNRRRVSHTGPTRHFRAKQGSFTTARR